MAFRNDIDALAARHAALEAEVEHSTRARDEAARLLEEARARDRDPYAELAANQLRRRQRSVRIGVIMSFALAIAIGLYALLGHQRASDRNEKAMRAMERFTNDMCRCTEPACTQHVVDEMTRWSQEMAKTKTLPPRMTEEQIKRAAALGERMSHCMQSAMSQDVRTTPDRLIK